MSDELLAAGFSAVLNKKVMTQTQFDAYKQTPEGRNAVAKKLTIEAVHQASLQRNEDAEPPEHQCDWRYQVFAQCGDSKRVCITIYHCDTIARLKYLIMQKLDMSISAAEVRLTYRDRDLSYSDATIGNCHIQDKSDIKVLLRVKGGAPKEVSILDSSLRDPWYDFDFTNITNHNTYYRGPHEYFRPYGWNRLALKVRGKFADDDWLGENRARTQASPGEWCVSYHGTPHANAVGIASEGFRRDRCVRSVYGEGIYSSPKIDVAERYSVVFQYGGKSYRLVFQNRCNPDDIDEVALPGGNYWVTKNDRNIRPYGICLKDVSGWCTIL